MSTAVVGQAGGRTASGWDELAPALARLDRALARAVAARRAEIGSDPPGAGGEYRGLVVGDGEVDRLLARPPGAPDGDADPDGEGLDDDGDGEGDDPLGPRFAWLGRCFGLAA